MHHRLIERPGSLGVLPLPPDYLRYPCLKFLRVFQVCDHHCPVFIQCRDYPPELIEWRHHLQRSAIGLKGHHHAQPRLFLLQPLQPPLLTPSRPSTPKSGHFEKSILVLQTYRDPSSKWSQYTTKNSERKKNACALFLRLKTRLYVY